MKLSTKSVGKDAAPVVVAAVDNTRATLTHADVSDIIAGRPEAEVLDVLRAVSAALARCRLRELDVSSNALGEKGIRACAEVLSAQGALEALYLENIGCSVNACAAVEELVRCATLRKVHLFNNMSDNAGARSIAALLARSPEMEVRGPLATPPSARPPPRSALVCSGERALRQPACAVAEDATRGRRSACARAPAGLQDGVLARRR